MTARQLIPVLLFAALSPGLGQTRPQSDAELEKAIRERFVQSKAVALDNFTVRVQGGVATIEGRTEVVQRKAAATRMARSAGARKVVNKIEVSDAARQKASERLSKGRRRAQVTRSEAQRK